MMERSPRRLPWGTLAWWCTVFAAAWLAVRSANTQVPDDGYIVWRFVQNLVAGDGWAFNRGEPVNGCTSPLQVMLLALPCWLSPLDVRSANCALCVLTLCTAGLCFAKALTQRAVPLLLACVVGLGVVLMPLQRVTLGLECQLQVACLGAFWVAWNAARYRRAGLLAGLCVLARPDSLLVVGLMVAPRWLRSRGAWRWQFPIAAAVVLAPWCAWSWWQFGELLPNTLAAKMAQGESGAWQVDHFVRELKVSLDRFDSWHLIGSYKPFLVVLIGGAIGALRGGVGWQFLLAALLHALAYVWLRVPFFHWYALPVHLALVLSPAMMLGVLQRWRHGSAFCTLLAVGLLVSSACMPAPTPRSSGYQEAAAWLQQNTAPDACIACYEIGQLGFGVRPRRIVDLAGLVTRAAVPHLRRTEWTWVLADPPDCFVLHEPPWPRLEAPLFADARFRAFHRVGPGFGDGVVLYCR